MNTFNLNKVTFYYPERENAALKELDLEIPQGQFVTVCGTSGCGKTTLLRQLKPALAPYGRLQGEILFEGEPLREISLKDQAAKIGFVFQNPENQIVTDKVWHELAFGLESLGFSTPEIRLRVAEMASFFGIQNWFYRDTSELSGGQKQLLNLAAVMTLQPSVIILDEPTAQLDPIAASDFLAALGRINRELGVTVILTEHRLEDAFPLSDRVLVLEHGILCCDGTPKEVGLALAGRCHSMFHALPTPMRIFASVPNSMECPVTVREGRTWLDELVKRAERSLNGRWKNRQNGEGAALVPNREADWSEQRLDKRPDRKLSFGGKNDPTASPAIEMKEVWFQYKKGGADVVKGLSLTVKRGEFLAILGGNGTGKTTALSLITGINTPYRGKVSIRGRWAALPQNPQSIFVKKTVRDDLLEMINEKSLSDKEKLQSLRKVTALCRLEELLPRHPYDLSGGEQQRAALAKVLLLEPEILLLDEPTKGLDGGFKMELAAILMELRKKGVTVVMVSHDLEFCAEHAQRCALFFDGSIVSEGSPREFFSGNSFYTTAANRMARHLFAYAVTPEDITAACGGIVSAEPERGWLRPLADHEIKKQDEEKLDEKKPDEEKPDEEKLDEEKSDNNKLKKERFGIRLGDRSGDEPEDKSGHKKRKDLAEQLSTAQYWTGDRRLPERTRMAALMVLLAIPFTIFMGIYYLDDRKYYFISTLILMEALLPFIMIFEKRKPQARELMVIAVLCGIAVAGNAAFFWLPQFKPVIAVVMISAVAFGGEAGFLVGAMSALLSNVFFGQGPWTPWQMFAFGLIGFLTGFFFRKGLLGCNKYALAAFGGFSAFFLYGGIMNPAAVLTYQNMPTKEMFYLAYLQGIPFDLIHAAATVFFLLAAAEPMLEKLERIKIKYGLIMERKSPENTEIKASYGVEAAAGVPEGIIEGAGVSKGVAANPNASENVTVASSDAAMNGQREYER